MRHPNEYSRKEDNSPWYISAILRVGVPSAIALFLIWFLTSEVKSDISVIKEAVKIHAEAAIHSAEGIREQNERLTYILQRICINGARTTEDRNNCLGGR